MKTPQVITSTCSVRTRACTRAHTHKHRHTHTHTLTPLNQCSGHSKELKQLLPAHAVDLIRAGSHELCSGLKPLPSLCSLQPTPTHPDAFGLTGHRGCTGCQDRKAVRGRDVTDTGLQQSSCQSREAVSLKPGIRVAERAGESRGGLRTVCRDRDLRPRAQPAGESLCATHAQSCPTACSRRCGAPAARHGALGAGGRWPRSLLALKASLAAGLPQRQLTLSGTPAGAMGRGCRKLSFTERTACPRGGGNAQSVHLSGNGRGEGAQEVGGRAGEAALLPSATRRQQRAPCLPNSGPPFHK